MHENEDRLMHDPKVVAFDIPRPWPQRDSLLRRTDMLRWEFRFAHVPKWQLWRGWRKFWIVAGRRIYWPPLITVWHVEPHGHDALTVCGRGKDGKRATNSRWIWHVHHWSIQIHPLQKLHRWLFERCEECGRRYPWGYAPVTHQWNQPRGPWFRVTRRAYHHQCSDLVSYRRMSGYDRELIRMLTDEILARTREDEPSLIDRFAGTHSTIPFHLGNRLQRLLGWERDDDYNLVKEPEDR